jgi:hypothetical protein
MAVKLIFSIVLFLSFLTILLIGFNQQQVTYTPGSYVNSTNINMTMVNTGLASVQICNYHSDIPILGGLIWGASCISDGISTLLGFATASTTIPWLGAIFLACVVSLIVIVVLILRGNGLI